MLGCNPSGNENHVPSAMELAAFPIIIKTTPAGALVSLDGAHLGNTPLSLSLESMGLDSKTMTGKSSILLELDGFHPQPARIILKPSNIEVKSHGYAGYGTSGDPTESVIVSFNLISLSDNPPGEGWSYPYANKKNAFLSTEKYESCEIVVDSDPPGASVLLNGTDMGETPCSFTMNHHAFKFSSQILLNLDGYHSEPAQFILQHTNLIAKSFSITRWTTSRLVSGQGTWSYEYLFELVPLSDNHEKLIPLNIESRPEYQ